MAGVLASEKCCKWPPDERMFTCINTSAKTHGTQERKELILQKYLTAIIK